MPDPNLPNFLIIGAGKSGTTSLWSYLNQHPQIGMSRIKEPSFFSMDEVHARGVDWYRKLYDGMQDKQARGEASNSYSAIESYPKTLDRIAETLGRPKLIYITRHPAARTESDWMQRSRIEDISFSDFIRTDPLHADKNQYLRCYERYASRFGGENILTLFYEDLRADPASLLKQVCAFLGVEESYSFETGNRHGQSSKGREFAFGLGKLRRLKLYADLSMMLPESVKRALRETLSKPKNVVRPVWRDEDRVWFRARYEAVSTAYLKRVGRRPDQWIWEG